MNTQLATSAIWSALDNLTDGIILLDSSGSVIFVNQSAQELLQVYHPPSTLYDIWEASGSIGDYKRWDRLLDAPTQIRLQTTIGPVDIQSKTISLQEASYIQLIVNVSHQFEDQTDSLTPEQLGRYITDLRRENKSLIQRVAQVERLRILSEASGEIAHSFKRDDLLLSLGNYMAQVTGAIGFSIYTWSADKEQIHFLIDASRVPLDRVERNNGIYQTQRHAILRQLLENNTLLILESPEYLPGQPSWKAIPQAYYVVLLPIFSGGEPFGLIALALLSSHGDLNENELQLLATLLNQTGIALERVSLFNSTVERERFLDSLGRVSLAINGTLNLSRVLNIVCQESRAIFDVDGVYVWQKEISTKDSIPCLVGIAADGHGRDSFIGTRITGNDSTIFASMIASTVSSQFINHFNRDQSLDILLPQPETVKAVLGVPLVRQGETLGVLVFVDRRQTQRFSTKDIDRANAFAVQVAIAFRNAQLVTSLRQLNEDLDQRVIERTRDLGQERERLALMLQTEEVNSAKMQAMLESIADGVLVADENGIIILVNNVIAEILGLSRDALLNRPVSDFSGFYGTSADPWIQTIQRWAKQTDSIEGARYLSDQIQIDGGRIVSVHLAPVLADDRFFGTVSIFRDITKEVEVDRIKSEFVSTVSHELRTPLTSIKGYTDLILMGATGIIGDTTRRYLNVIKSNTDRLQELVNDLLDISRIETGKTTLDLRPVDVSKLVHKIVQNHLQGRVEHEKKVIHTAVNLADNLPLVTADATRVTQILTNLVDNAFNYTPADGTITISACEKEGFVHISVQDTGIGIAPENVNKIFDRFYRSDDARVQRVSGTGLGLSIVNSLVEMHGGHLVVESEPEQGSKFTFNLPCVVEEANLI